MKYLNKKFIFILVITFILNLSLNAQIIYVKQGASGAGTSWANARGDLRSAILLANVGDQVWVAEGTYYPGASQGDEFRMKNGVTVYGGFPNVGNPVLGDRDPVVHPTIMSGDIDGDGLDAQNTYHVLYANGTINNTAILDGFIISGGFADSENSGGGIYLRNASPTIRNCVITNNYAQNDGGAMYMRDNCSNAVFTNCTFSNNDANDDGGGLYLTNANCNPTFINCTIDSNHGDDDGGGVRINNCSPIFSNCTITNNVIDDPNNNGGGFFISGSSNPSIQNCTISNNIATSRGGGIYTVSTALTNAISGNIIDGNQISGGNAYGGGIYLDNSSPAITGNFIRNNILTNTTTSNSRAYGAGLYIIGNDIVSVISNNTIENNIATCNTTASYCGRGGGMYINASPVAIQNNVIRNNVAKTDGTGTSCGYGGGIYMYRVVGATLVSGNTISGNNSIMYGAGLYTYQSNPNITNNTFDANIINSGYDGGGEGAGICIYDNTGAGDSPVLSGNTITNNQANDNGHANTGYGGGICIRTNVAPVLTLNTIENNSASQRGGGIYIRDNASNAVFNRNEIKNNNSANGGAFYISGNMTVEIYNNLIYSNTATNGGGIYFNANDGANFLNNTIADNSASNGGAVYFNSDADLHIKNTLFWGNTAAISGNTVYINDGGSDPYFQYSNVQGGTAGFTGGGSGGSYNAGHYTNNIEVDPLFSDGVYHITLGTSPAIGAGDPATATGDFPADEDYDAAKRVRGVIDIGAYETNNYPQFVSLPYPPITDNPGPVSVIMDEDASPTAFSLTLNGIDIDDDNLIWSIISAPTNGIASVPANTTVPNAQSNSITYNPNANYNGTDMFVVQIYDGALTDNIQVDVTINSINDAPTFATTPPTLFAKANKTWSYNISTMDVDDPLNTLVLTCPSKPAGMTFVAGANGTATLTWTPTDLQESPPNYTVTLRVQDPHGDFVEQTFDLTVNSRFIYVPADYPTIQQAINAAVDTEDKIIIADGTYPENINTNGKTIEIEGNTVDPSKVIIDGTNSGPCIVIDQGGTPIIRGMTLTNGNGQVGLPSGNNYHAPASGFYGGSIVINNSDPTLIDMIIDNNNLGVNNNHGGSGAGIYIGDYSNVTIKGISIIFKIINNSSTTYRGGGICVDDSNLDIQNAEISNNFAGNYGGGIALYFSVLDMTNVNITNNSVSGENGYGGGIFLINSTINDNGGNTNSGNTASRSGNNIFSLP